MDASVNCLLCNSGIANERSVVTLGEKGVSSLINACVSRGQHSLQEAIVTNKSVGRNITVHKDCRKRFTDLRNVDDEKKENQRKENTCIIRERVQLENLLFVLWTEVRHQTQQ